MTQAPSVIQCSLCEFAIAAQGPMIPNIDGTPTNASEEVAYWHLATMHPEVYEDQETANVVASLALSCLHDAGLDPHFHLSFQEGHS